MRPGGIEAEGTNLPSPAPLIHVVRSLDQALSAAAEAETQGLALRLESEAGAGAHVGFGWFASLVDLVRERHPGLEVTSCLDCADLPASAIGAMRRGLRHIRFSAASPAWPRLQGMAAAFGAKLEPGSCPGPFKDTQTRR
ncbi:MAG TPA: hypothetical protein VL574_03720 [Stellaceae bacterium]|nr:hypothetical protein [Stellaceae bacterium]